MALTFQDLFDSPDHYLFAFEGDDALFRPMDRAAYRRSIFLDRRISPADDGVMRVPIAQLIQAAPPGPPPEVRWIFHVAHCGSTLLARAFDAGGDTLVLREPAALRQLGVARSEAPEWRAVLRAVLAMLGKRYGDGAPVVKANVPVNVILPDILALRPDAKGILLHFGLEDYLTAILRTDDHRAWLRVVSDELGVPGETDAEKAAMLWLSQLRAYQAALSAHPGLVSLDAAQLLADPLPAINAAAAYFGVPLAGDLGGLLTANSKRPGEAFSPEARATRHAALRESLGAELRAARRHIEPAASSLAARLANPLVEGGKPLLG